MYKPLEAPADHRLAFRELGLSIGLKALAEIPDGISKNRQRFPDSEALVKISETIASFAPLQTRIEQFWFDPHSQRCAMWKDHENINAVMLATSLVPEVFLMSIELPAGIDRATQR